MNLLTSVLLYSGSAASSRFGISRRLGIFQFLLLRSLRAVLRTALLPPRHADGVERPTDHVIPHARQVLHTAAADQHQRVLLEVVADDGDVGRDLDPVGQADARDLAQ